MRAIKLRLENDVKMMSHAFLTENLCLGRYCLIMDKGTDIFGNPVGTDVQGNPEDKNIQGERPKDVQGNVLKDIFGNPLGETEEETKPT